jgi:hypothetical protein
MFKGALNKAKGVMDSTKSMVSGSVDAAREKVPDLTAPKELFDKYWGAIEQYAASALSYLDEKDWVDDVVLTFAFKHAHGMIPLPIRIFVNEDNFVNMCLNQKNALASKVRAYKADPAASPLLLPPESSADESSNSVLLDEAHRIAPTKKPSWTDRFKR